MIQNSEKAESRLIPVDTRDKKNRGALDTDLNDGYRKLGKLANGLGLVLGLRLVLNMWSQLTKNKLLEDSGDGTFRDPDE